MHCLLLNKRHRETPECAQGQVECARSGVSVAQFPTVGVLVAAQTLQPCVLCMLILVMVTIRILCDICCGCSLLVILLLASHLLQGQNLLGRDRRRRVVLVVIHVDVVLGKLVSLVARDALTHL